MNNNDELNSLINALTIEIKEPSQNVSPQLPNSDDEIFDTLMTSIMDNINKNKEMLEHSKEMSESTGEPEYIEAFASVSKNQTELIKTLSSMLLERKKLKKNSELKTRDLDIKEKAVDNNIKNAKLGDTPTLQQNNIFLTDKREAVFDMLFGSPEQKKKLIEKHLGEDASNIIEVSAEDIITK